MNTVVRHRWIYAAGLVIAIGMGATPLWAAQSQGEDAVPASKSQAETLKEVPDNKSDSRTEATGETTDDMPSTKSQQQHLKESQGMTKDDKAKQPQSGQASDPGTGTSSGSE